MIMIITIYEDCNDSNDDNNDNDSNNNNNNENTNDNNNDNNNSNNNNNNNNNDNNNDNNNNNNNNNDNNNDNNNNNDDNNVTTMMKNSSSTHLKELFYRSSILDDAERKLGFIDENQFYRFQAFHRLHRIDKNIESYNCNNTKNLIYSGIYSDKKDYLRRYDKKKSKNTKRLIDDKKRDRKSTRLNSSHRR